MRRITLSYLRLTVVSALASAAFAASAVPAHAEFGIASFDSETLTSGGAAATQAGSHPYETRVSFDLNATGDLPDGDLKNVEVDLPRGFVGDPSATPKCGSLEALREALCPNASQVGLALVEFGAGGGDVFAPIYNVEAPPGVPARFGFTAQSLVVLFDSAVRSDGDYGLRINVRNVSQQIPVLGTNVTFWGVPAHPSHDLERGFHPDIQLPCAFLNTVAVPCSNPAGVAQKAFLTNPTACTPPGVGLPWTMRADSWQNPGVFDSATVLTHEAGDPNTQAGPTGCEVVPFTPQFEVQPTSSQPDAPSGYTVELRIPQSQDPNLLAQSHLKKAVVTLPPGVSVNPASAGGLAACSPAEIGITNGSNPSCPEASKIGSLELDTPLLEDPMTGEIYVAKQADNPFGSLLALYLVARGPGVVIKLAGKVTPDPVTGQLTTTFDNNPQLPFRSLKLRFKGGARAPLANPPQCGEMTANAELSPWSGNAPAHRSDSFTIACPGMFGFSPAFTAGLVTPTAGGSSPLVVRVERADGQEIIDGLDVHMPSGLVGRVRGIPLCGSAAAAAGACPAESRIGTATIGAGAGAQPYFLNGGVFLTEGYKGAPFGLAIAVPAVAGPYNLGTVVVRQALFVDPTTAEITVDSDAIPTILEGIPLRLRAIQVEIDRPGFMVAPTSCAEKQITAVMHSQQGSTSTAQSRFQVGDCRGLDFSPRLAVRLSGARQTNDGGHPALKAVLRQPADQANIREMAVTLPKSLALDPENARALCEFEAGQRVDCPASSIVGRARAVTPLLNRPLSGPVYFVKGIRIDRRTGRRIRTLPTLLITLKGEIDIVLRARSSVRRGNLVSNFEAIPDTGISTFELNLQGGNKGILVANSNLCRRKHVARARGRGHNGARSTQRIGVRTPCKGGATRRKKRR